MAKRTKAEQEALYGEPRRSPAEVADIVQRLADDMAAGRWVSGISHKRMAQEYGVARNTVAKWAAEAARRVITGENDEELQQMRAETIGRLDAISLKAEASRQYTAAVKAIDSKAIIAGLNRTGPALVINLESPATATDRRLRGQLDALLGNTMDALARALGECVPDRATRGRVLARVAELLDPNAGDGAMVVATDVGKDG